DVKRDHQYPPRRGWRRLRSERGSVVIQLRWREVHDLGTIPPLSFGGSTISKRDDSGGVLRSNRRRAGMREQREEKRKSPWIRGEREGRFPLASDDPTYGPPHVRRVSGWVRAS